MKRRHLLAIAAGSAIVGTSGCLDQSETTGNGPTENEPPANESDDEELPGRPDDLRERGTDFVEAYEKTVSEGRLTCRAEVFYEGDEVLYEKCKCADMSTDGGSWAAVGHVMYAVTSDDVTRVASSISSHPETYGAADVTNGPNDTYGFWFGCFDERGYDVSVQIRYRTDDGDVVVLDEAWSESTVGAKFVTDVSTAEGTYELHVERADGTTRVEPVSTRVESASAGYRVIASVVVTPSGELLILQDVPERRHYWPVRPD